MNYNYVFNNNILDTSKLLKYGFIDQDKKYLYKYDYSKDFYFIVTISDNSFIIKAYDSYTNEEYVLFNVIDAKGILVSSLRDKASSLVLDIINNCFTNTNVLDRLLNYVYNKYNTIPIYPWKDDNKSATLTVNNKWYGLLMNINSKSLGLDINTKIDVINLKCNNIDEIVDNISIFRAYHMNKKYWITIILDSRISFDMVTKLIDDSYNLIKKV